MPITCLLCNGGSSHKQTDRNPGYREPTSVRSLARRRGSNSSRDTRPMREPRELRSRKSRKSCASFVRYIQHIADQTCDGSETPCAGGVTSIVVIRTAAIAIVTLG